MEGPAVAILFLFVVGIAIVIRLIAGSMDGDRVDDYVRTRGGKLISKHWSPFGRGWFGEKDSRIYEIEYIDADGNRHQATCKTSMLSGVYMTEDRIVGRASQKEIRANDREETYPADEYEHDESFEHNDIHATDFDELVAENLQLQEEIRQLKEIIRGYESDNTQ